MVEKVKYYVEVPIMEFGVVSGWSKWSPWPDYSLYKTPQDEWNTLEEAQEAVFRDGLTCYRIIQDIHTVAVVDSQYRW